MLYGHGTFDNRGIIYNNDDCLLTYQCEKEAEANDKSLVYCADSYFGMLDDEFSLASIHFTNMDIAVSRIPANRTDYAERTNNKIINYKDRCLSFMYDDEDRNWVKNDIWLCDTMPNEYLVIEYDGESFDFIPTKVAK